MGGEQSRTRKITVENEDPTSVIKVSDDVVRRIRNSQDAMEPFQGAVINWRSEAQAVKEDIKSHVRDVEIANFGNANLVYLNITTLEASDYCIELSARGFRVVGNAYDQIDMNSQEFFETPYSLLDSISPLFHRSFGSELLKKLTQLEQSQLQLM